MAAAIADPVRRDILVMLREQRLPAGQIADRFVISRPAVSRHLRVLRESGLVRDTLVGRVLTYDSLKMKFREFKLRKDESCPVCEDLLIQTALSLRSFEWPE